MAVLHFRVTKQNDNIDLSRTLHSQNLTLRRIIITRNRSVITNSPLLAPVPSDNFIPEYTTDLKGGIIVDISFFKGFEILSNFVSNDILVPFGNEVANIDNRYNLNFANEDIALSFNVQCYDFERKNAVVFQSDTSATTDGAIKYIDLFFDFDNLYDYSTY
jgi:hypothetical protein